MLVYSPEALPTAFEVSLRHMILQLYWEYEMITLVIDKLPVVTQAKRILSFVGEDPKLIRLFSPARPSRPRDRHSPRALAKRCYDRPGF